MATPKMDTWEEQLASLSKAEATTKEAEEEENKDPSPSKAVTMGLDFAAQLKAHFVACLVPESQSYGWFSSLSALQGAAPPSTPQEGEKVKESTPLGGIRTGEN